MNCACVCFLQAIDVFIRASLASYVPPACICNRYDPSNIQRTLFPDTDQSQDTFLNLVRSFSNHRLPFECSVCHKEVKKWSYPLCSHPHESRNALTQFAELSIPHSVISLSPFLALSITLVSHVSKPITVPSELRAYLS